MTIEITHPNNVCYFYNDEFKYTFTGKSGSVIYNEGEEDEHVDYQLPPNSTYQELIKYNADEEDLYFDVEKKEWESRFKIGLVSDKLIELDKLVNNIKFKIIYGTYEVNENIDMIETIMINIAASGSHFRMDVPEKNIAISNIPISYALAILSLVKVIKTNLRAFRFYYSNLLNRCNNITDFNLIKYLPPINITGESFDIYDNFEYELISEEISAITLYN